MVGGEIGKHTCPNGDRFYLPVVDWYDRLSLTENRHYAGSSPARPTMAQIEYTDEQIQKGVTEYFDSIKYWPPENLHDPMMVTVLIERILYAVQDEE